MSTALGFVEAYMVGTLSAAGELAGKATPAGRIVKLTEYVHNLAFFGANSLVFKDVESALAASLGSMTGEILAGAAVVAAFGAVEATAPVWVLAGVAAMGAYGGGLLGEAAYNYLDEHGYVDEATDFGEAFANAVADAATEAVAAFQQGITNAEQLASRAFDAFQQSLTNAWQNASSFFQDLLGALDNASQSFGDWFGQHFGPSFGDGGLFGGGGATGSWGAPQTVAPYMQSAKDAFGFAASMISPLVLDLNGDGVNLTALSSSTTFFDLDADGFAQHTGWVASEDGLLALDRNSNGTIDDITELFGTGNSDAFSSLGALDSNFDGVIDANDSAFSQLRVWQDTNQDGVSQTSELKSLADLGITSLSLSAIAVNQSVNGNAISASGLGVKPSHAAK